MLGNWIRRLGFLGGLGGLGGFAGLAGLDSFSSFGSSSWKEDWLRRLSSIYHLISRIAYSSVVTCENIRKEYIIRPGEDGFPQMWL